MSLIAYLKSLCIFVNLLILQQIAHLFSKLPYGFTDQQMTIGGYLNPQNSVRITW